METLIKLFVNLRFLKVVSTFEFHYFFNDFSYSMYELSLLAEIKRIIFCVFIVHGNPPRRNTQGFSRK